MSSLYATKAKKLDSDRVVRTRYKCMRHNTKLEPWQILGVARLLEIRSAGRPLHFKPYFVMESPTNTMMSTPFEKVSIFQWMKTIGKNS
jgi:hypothetical protein